MVTKEQINRINELAAKAKTKEGLTPAEIKEREQLRKAYIASVRENVKANLKNVKFVEDLTPEEQAAYREKNEKKPNKN